MRICESGIVFHGDSENRGPEADFGPPGAENQHFQNFRPNRKIENATFHCSAKIVARILFSKPFRVQELPGRCFVRELPKGGLGFPPRAILFKKETIKKYEIGKRNFRKKQKN